MKKILIAVILFLANSSAVMATSGQLRSVPTKEAPTPAILALYTYSSNIVLISPAQGDAWNLIAAVDRFFQMYKDTEAVSAKIDPNPTNGALLMTIIVRPKSEETRTAERLSEIDTARVYKG